MLVRCLLTAEGPQTSLTFVTGRPVACGIHMLVACPIGTEDLGTCLAFSPVPKVVHMLIAGLSVIEDRRATCAFVHLE